MVYRGHQIGLSVSVGKYPGRSAVCRSYRGMPQELSRPSTNKNPFLAFVFKLAVVCSTGYQLFQPHLSPNGRWIVFEAVANSPNPESTLYVVSASGGAWTRITDSKQWDDKPRWSPDGRTIYFVSRRGGFFNVWGIHFDPAVGK